MPKQPDVNRTPAGAGVLAVALVSLLVLVSLHAGASGADDPKAGPSGVDVSQGTVETHEWEGWIGCSLNYPVSFQPWTCPDPENDVEHVFTVEPGLRSLLVRMEWDSVDSCTGDHLRHWLYVPADAERPAVRMQEASPIEYRVDAGDTMGLPFEEIEEPTELRFRVWGPSNGFQLCQDQPFTVHYELYYEEAAEEPPVPPVTEWPALEDAVIRPGVKIGGGSCTANFIFSSPDNATLYIGTASHCVGGRGLGAGVTIAGIPRAGELAYCSWMHTENRNGCPSADSLLSGNDFALVKIREEHRAVVHPAMHHWGGPTGIGDQPPSLTRVHTYGNSGLNPLPQMRPMEGVTTASNPTTTTIYSLRPGVFGDSGSPVVRADGSTVGVLVAVNLVTGQNIVSNLDNALAYMKQQTGLDVELKTWENLRDTPLPVG